MKEFRIAIVGGGLSGALMAIYVAQAGHAIDVYEKRSDPNRKSKPSGRNINLAITSRSLQILETFGLTVEVERASMLMEGREFHSRDGVCHFQPYAEPGGPNRSILTPEKGVRSISRNTLNRMLIEKAKALPNVRFHYGHELESLNHIENELTFVTPDGQTKTVDADLIVGADGAFSKIRRELVRSSVVTEKVIPSVFGYKEFQIGASAAGGFAWNEKANHLWPREGFLLVALPNPDQSFRCTLFLPLTGKNSFEALEDHETVRRFLAENFSDAAGIMSTPVDDFFASPIGKLQTLQCTPWFAGSTILIGDACHAMLPFTGQGVNAAFEDCHSLMQCVKQFENDMPSAFKEFSRIRKQVVDRIATLGIAVTPFLMNFVPEDGDCRSD